MKPARRLRRLLVAALTAACPAPVSAAAAPPDTASAVPDSLQNPVETIVVTGTRTRQRMIDVPYAMDRIDLDDQRFERLVSIGDVLDEVPGVFLQSRYGNHDVRISIRGYGSRSNSGIRGVRMLMDGIPESEPDGQTRIEAVDFQSVGRIEIVKGNASSLYTNAPGGVVNFISDLDFRESFLVNFNQFGDHDLYQNGFKCGVRTDDYKLLTTYSYHNGGGYRAHGNDYWHIANTVLEVAPRDRATLHIYGYFVDGKIRLPGSLTRDQFEADPWQANPRDVARDTSRLTKKGRLGLRFESAVGEDDEIELTGYGTIKYFERTSSTYRIMNRDGLGASGRYVNRRELFGRRNELSGAVDWFYQYGPIQSYENINGRKGDILRGLTDETIGNVGFYVSNSIDLVPRRLSLLLTGRYDHVFFEARNQLLESQNASRTFDDFTPKAALDYKLTPDIALYTSFGLGFDTPAGNELDNFPTSSDPNRLLNPDLDPQESKNFEIGVKGGIVRPEETALKRVDFSATFFAIRVEDEIVPFDVFGDVFYRNAAETHRNGIELGVGTDIVDGLRFHGAWTFSDFTYHDYAAGTVGIDSLGNVVVDNEDFSGNAVPSVPRNHVSLSLTWERRLAEQVTGFGKVHYAAVSGLYANDANSEKSDSYQLVDPLVGVEVRVGALDLRASGGVNNLFDETYVGFVNINSTSGEFYEVGEPRSWFASLDLGHRF